MKRHRCLFLGMCCILALTCLPVFAQIDETSSSPKRWVLSAYTENDSSYYVPGSNADRYYTHGTKFVLTSQLMLGDKLASELATVLPIGKQEPIATSMGFVLGQNIYSPDNINNTVLNPNDRPYAGWLYSGLFLERSIDDREMDHLELDMGIVGPSAMGKPIQKFVHSYTSSPEPRGWDDQLHDEFGINFIYTRKWKFKLLDAPEGGFAIQAIPQAGFTAGNVNRDLNGALTFRAGWNLPADFGPGRLDDVVSSTTPQWHKDISAYCFVRAGGKYVEHDIFISGNNDHDSHGVAEEHWVGEVQYGMAIAWRKFMVHWSNRHITREFEGQQNQHIVGTWLLSYSQSF